MRAPSQVPNSRRRIGSGVGECVRTSFRMRVPSRLPPLHMLTPHLTRPLTAACFAIALVACADRGTPEPAVIEQGGTVVVGISAEPGSLLPPFVVNTHEAAISEVVYDRLADIGPELETAGDADFTPRLATAWRWADDSLSIAFTLDERARWHDGQPLSSEDVRLSFQLYTHPDVVSKNAPLLGNIDSVSTPDANTATFWFKRRSPQQFYDAVHHLFIMPSHLLADVEPSQLETVALARAPVGTGRFKFVQWVSGQRVEIIADTVNYRGRPNLDRVIFIPTADATAATISLLTGDIDFFSPLRVENMEQATSSPGVTVHMYPARTYQHVALNVRNPAALSAPHPVLGDRAVRRALNLATNRERIVQTVFDSIARVSIGPAVRLSMPGYDELKMFDYNVDAARALLDSAGWTMGTSDSVRAKNRVPLRIELLVPAGSASREQMATLLQDQLRAVGAAVTVQRLEVNTLVQRIETGKFDAYTGGFATSPGNVGLRQSWGVAGIGGRGLNHPGYNSAEFNAHIDTALTTFDRATKQRTMLRAMQTIIDDAPAIWLLEDLAPAGVHSRIELGAKSALGWWHGLHEWRISPSQRIDRDRVGLVSTN